MKERFPLAGLCRSIQTCYEIYWKVERYLENRSRHISFKANILEYEKIGTNLNKPGLHGDASNEFIMIWEDWLSSLSLMVFFCKIRHSSVIVKIHFRLKTLNSVDHIGKWKQACFKDF